MKLPPFVLPTLAVSLLGLVACRAPENKPLATETKVDLPRFMGPWYVIANIPTFIEKGAHNAIESYRLDADGSIATTFTFRKGAYDGPEKRYTPRGFVVDPDSKAVWVMRFLWPFNSDYRIVYLSPGYSQTIIGREKRDYVWIMARSPEIPEAEYQALLRLVEAQGYDLRKVQKVPQRW